MTLRAAAFSKADQEHHARVVGSLTRAEIVERRVDEELARLKRAADRYLQRLEGTRERAP